MTLRRSLYFLLLASLLTACDQPVEFDASADAQGHSAPTAATARANQALYEELDFSDELDFEFARRGLLASDPDLRVLAEDGNEVWNMPAYAFISGEAPASVNPSLWRQAQLNNIHGLFQVAEGIYQLRGYDLSNMTMIEGETGWIIVDPLTARETAAAALAFALQHLAARPVVGDDLHAQPHRPFWRRAGRAFRRGTVQENERADHCAEGFMEEATSENIIAGTGHEPPGDVHVRQAPGRSERGHVASGLGISPAFGTLACWHPPRSSTARRRST